MKESNQQEKKKTPFLIRIQKGGQIRFPKEILDSRNLHPGDIFEVEDTGSKITFSPKTLIDKTPEIELTPTQAKIKSRAISKLRNGKGITAKEAIVLTVAGFIPIEKKNKEG
jgi:AbrB family looped-hinge helix DNA binding protein